MAHRKCGDHPDTKMAFALAKRFDVTWSPGRWSPRPTPQGSSLGPQGGSGGREGCAAEAEADGSGRLQGTGGQRTGVELGGLGWGGLVGLVAFSTYHGSFGHKQRDEQIHTFSPCCLRFLERSNSIKKNATNVKKHKETRSSAPLKLF